MDGAVLRGRWVGDGACVKDTVCGAEVLWIGGSDEARAMFGHWLLVDALGQRPHATLAQDKQNRFMLILLVQ